jgi:hypothetical protein
LALIAAAGARLIWSRSPKSGKRMEGQSYGKIIVRTAGCLLLLAGIIGAVAFWADLYFPSRVPTAPASLVTVIQPTVMPAAAGVIGLLLVAYAGKIVACVSSLLPRKSN